MRLSELTTKQTFNITFKAQLPNGKQYVKKFKIQASDKYTASDKVKEKLGKLYDQLIRPTFIFGDTEKRIASDYVSTLARGLKE